jgi:DNA-binding CsgD family transcriptional regulator
MSSLPDIIKGRSAPGILIFDLQGRLVFSNRQALDMLASGLTGKDSIMSVIEEIHRICEPWKKKAVLPGSPNEKFESPVLTATMGICYSLRSFLLDDHETKNWNSHILVLIEKVIEQHNVDMEKARREFSLTKREGEIISFICKGLTNREISKKIFISEYTVKVHIRNIMKKMKAGTRNEIFALLK